MSILEFLESRGNKLSHDERVWFCGWEDSYINGGSYHGWVDLDEDDHIRYAAVIVDYLDYVKDLDNSMMDHYYLNEPMAVSCEVVKSGSR